MPLNLSFTHIMVVLVVALVVLGPDRLPDAARSAARVIGELRRMSSGLQAEVRDTFGDFAEPFTDLVSTVKGTMTLTPPAAPEPLNPPEARPVEPSAPALPTLPDLGSEPRPGTFSHGPPVAGPVFTPLNTPEPGRFSPGA